MIRLLVIYVKQSELKYEVTLMALDDNISRFITAVTAQATRQSEDIKKQTHDYISSELDKAETEVLKESYELIKRRSSDIRKNSGRDLSKKQLEIKKLLIDQRKIIEQKILNDVADKIVLFTKTNDYINFLEISAKKIKNIFQAGIDVELYLRPDDIKYSSTIQNILGDNFIILEDNSIKLGGIKALCHLSGIIVDDTLDTRLEKERTTFKTTKSLLIK